MICKRKNMIEDSPRQSCEELARYSVQWIGIMVVCFIFLTVGCAGQKPIWGDPDTGLILTYRAVEGNARKYRNTITVDQNLEMIGQKTETKTDMDFTVVSKAKEAQNLVLGITIDKLSVDIDGTRGNTSLETSGIPGKGFDMILSPQGEELDVAGAAELTYETSPFAKSNLTPLFQRIFPDLPSRPVREGDTWTSVNNTTSGDGNAEMNSLVEYVYTLGGFETVDGLECARITGKMTGTLTGKGNQMGSDYTLGGKLEGISTWYFAYEEGILLSQVMTFTGDVNIKSAMGSMPMKLENAEEIRLVQ